MTDDLSAVAQRARTALARYHELTSALEELNERANDANVNWRYIDENRADFNEQLADLADVMATTLEELLDGIQTDRR